MVPARGGGDDVAASQGVLARDMGWDPGVAVFVEVAVAGAADEAAFAIGVEPAPRFAVGDDGLRVVTLVLATATATATAASASASVPTTTATTTAPPTMSTAPTAAALSLVIPVTTTLAAMTLVVSVM